MGPFPFLSGSSALSCPLRPASTLFSSSLLSLLIYPLHIAHCRLHIAKHPYYIHLARVVRIRKTTMSKAESTKRAMSGLQKEVLGLYRTIMREALKKDRQAAGDITPIKRLQNMWQDPDTSSSFARQEFRKQVGLVKKNDFRTIEHKIRFGYKQVKLLQMPGVKVVGRPSGN